MKKTIVLFDHIDGGHHFAFAKLFAKYLLKLEYRVVLILSEGAEKVKFQLQSEGTDVKDLIVLENCPPMKGISGGILKTNLHLVKFWFNTNKLLKRAEAKIGITIDTVFFCWLDSSLHNYIPFQLIDAVFHFRWSGLFFHPWYLLDNDIDTRVTLSSVDHMLLSKNCTSVALHDEFLVDKLQNRIQKKVVCFPEIADSTPPEEANGLATQLKISANGRFTMGLIGLNKRKGLINYIDLIESVSPSDYFFLLAGEISFNDFSESEVEKINKFLRNLPPHVLYHNKFIEEGAKINAVINALDALFLIYDNFKSSSNFNTKAALFKKPVLATDKYWIGANTEKYRLGITVPEGDTAKAVQGLNQLKNAARNDHNFGYEEYLSVHNEQMLEIAFQEALEP